MAVNFQLLSSYELPLSPNQLKMDVMLSTGSFPLLITALVAIFPVILYVSSPGSRLFKEFPTAGLNEKDGLRKIDEARKRWFEHGASIIEEGLKKVSIDSTVPHVHTSVCSKPLTCRV